MSLRTVTSCPLELLGRHVGRRAGADVLDLADGRQAEVHDADPAAPSSMMFAGFKSRCRTPRSCAAASPAQICRAISRPLSSGSRPMRRSRIDEILAVHVLHRDEQLPVELADVVDAADVRVRHLPRRPHFVVELREPHRRPATDRPAGTSARPAARGAGRRRDTPRPCRRARAGRGCDSGCRGPCRARSGRDRSIRTSAASRSGGTGRGVGAEPMGPVASVRLSTVTSEPRRPSDVVGSAVSGPVHGRHRDRRRPHPQP